MPQLPLQRASGRIISFHQAYQYWRRQLSSCQIDRGLKLTPSRSLERRNHRPSGWLSRRWNNKRRKSNNNKKTVEISTKDARPGAGDTGAPTGWCQCQGENATKNAAPVTPTALYPLRHPWQPCRLEVPLSGSANQSYRLTLYLRDVVPDAAAPAAAWHSPPAPHLAGLGRTY